MPKSIVNRYPPVKVVDAVRAFVRLTGRLLWRIKYVDKENMPAEDGRGLIIVANHQTYFDPFWICAPFRRKYRFMAWDKAFDWFFVGWLIRYLGSFPVDTKRGTTKNVLRESFAALRDGATLIIFPEGARSFPDGALVTFRTGAVRIALETGAPILPVTIRGANRVWSQTMKYPRLETVEIVYHPVIEVAPPPVDADRHDYLEEVTEKLKSTIAAKL